MRLLIVDAFTDRAFAGNPAAVVVCGPRTDDGPSGPDAAWMQQLARELGFSETAFVRGEGPRYGLRWFTPGTEVDLCGHATLATAHVLHTSGRPGPYTFDTRSGPLHAEVHDGAISLDFPAKPVQRTDEAATLSAVLGVPVLGTYRSDADVLVEVADEATVRAARPDLTRLLALADVRGVIVTAASSADGPTGSDLVSRFFAPALGVDEDPVTGSAHCALGPFWAARLGRTELIGRQLSRRGGRVLVRVRGDRVELTGHAVTVVDGALGPVARPDGSWATIGA